MQKGIINTYVLWLGNVTKNDKYPKKVPTIPIAINFL
jgi:hypothetical protein